MDHKIENGYVELLSIFVLAVILLVFLIYKWQTNFLNVMSLVLSIYGITSSVFTIYKKKNQYESE